MRPSTAAARLLLPVLTVLLVAGCTGTSPEDADAPRDPRAVVLPGSQPVADLALAEGRVHALTGNDAGLLLVALDGDRPDAGLSAPFPGRPGELLEVRGTLLASTRAPDTVLALDQRSGETRLLAELADAGGVQLATDGGDSFAVSGPDTPGGPVRLAVLSGDVVATGIPLPLLPVTGPPAAVTDLAVVRTDASTSLVVATTDAAGTAALTWLDVTVPGAVNVPRTEVLTGSVAALGVDGTTVLAATTRADGAWLVSADGGEVELGTGQAVDLAVGRDAVAVAVQDGGTGRVVVTETGTGRVLEEVVLGNGVAVTALAADGAGGWVAGGSRGDSPVVWLLG